MMKFVNYGIKSMILLFIFFSFNATATNPTISVIVPCCYKHAHLLPHLLDRYQQQTVLPDEVVISLSGINKISHSLKRKIKTKQRPFPVNLITTQKHKYGGENRNIACTNATGDVFLCQDADDIPHPQRIEIVKYFFKNYDIDHLMHGYYIQGDIRSFRMYHKFKPLKVENVTFSYHKEFNLEWVTRNFITNGNPAISKKVFETIQWPENPLRGQDIVFNEQVYKQFDNCMIVQEPLYIYRYNLSAAKESWNNKASKVIVNN